MSVQSLVNETTVNTAITRLRADNGSFFTSFCIAVIADVKLSIFFIKYYTMLTVSIFRSFYYLMSSPQTIFQMILFNCLNALILLEFARLISFDIVLNAFVPPLQTCISISSYWICDSLSTISENLYMHVWWECILCFVLGLPRSILGYKGVARQVAGHVDGAAGGRRSVRWKTVAGQAPESGSRSLSQKWRGRRRQQVMEDSKHDHNNA